MPDFSLVPVDYQPDFGDVSFVPVDHDPFAPNRAEDIIHQANVQSASQPQQTRTYNNPEGDAAAMSPETYVNPIVKRTIGNLLTLPRRAIDASATDVQHFGEDGYTPQAIGPAVETALTTMGGAGAVQAGMIPGAKGVARAVAEQAGPALRRAVPKDVAFATHEAIPGADTGHLPGSINASPEARAGYSADPRSTWAFTPGGRDAIYAGGGGKGVPTQPTIEMQGMYPRPDGIVETNPGWTALPQVSSDSVRASTVLPADRNMLNASEAVRGYVDAQNASAWHKVWREGNSLFMPMPGKATPEQLLALKRRGETVGLPDVADSGQGVTMTRFGPAPDDIGPALRESKLASDIKSVASVEPQRVTVDHGFIDYVPEWQQGGGSGAATREMLSRVNVTPEVRAAMNDNADIPKAALARLERDQEYSRQWGVTREDIQNARKVIGEGKGWVDRLEAAMKAGAILPALGFAILGDRSGDRS